MKAFRIRLAMRRGDLAFAIADLSERADRKALSLARKSESPTAIEDLLGTLTPVWDFSSPRKVSIPTGWAHFSALRAPIVSADMWQILEPFAPTATWHEIPSLSTLPPHARWGWMKNIPRADVLDMEKTQFSHLGELLNVVWAPNLATIPDFFKPTNAPAFFVSETCQIAMKSSKLTGFDLEEIG